MISVAEAQRRILEAFQPLPPEMVGLAQGLGRVLAADITARVTQPPHAVSAMDGYAVRAADVATVPVTLEQIGEAPAGRAFAGSVEAGQTVRIFTGATVPNGADSIVIQEDTETDGTAITVKEKVSVGRYIRPAGLDFAAGDTGLPAGRLLGPRDIGLAAAMNVPWLPVRRRPRVAILATGDEIVLPGDPLAPDQIVSSNSWALAAFAEQRGGVAHNLGIAPDNSEALQMMAASAAGADILVTTGGASVGDHDLVQSALGKVGLEVDFWRVAMRPGKPLMFGGIRNETGTTPLLGLPGNPVSSLVCALLFLGPILDRMLNRAPVLPKERARLDTPMPKNDRREDYVRATLRSDGGTLRAKPFEKQDSSMLKRLVDADCLIIRAPHAPAVDAGEAVTIVRFDPPSRG